MTRPGKEDLRFDGSSALKKFKKNQKETHNEWSFASINDVKYQFKKFDLEDNVIFVKGDVMKTLKKEENLPEKIALIRLDTDWYESTKFEMNVLYPKLVKNGVLLIDDYSDWQGCKKAIDEYIKNKGAKKIEYHIDLEINNELTPKTWKKKLI